MSQKTSLAVLISNTGTGTNLKAIIDGINAGRISAEIAAVVCDRPEAAGLKHAEDNNLKIEICLNKDGLLSLLQKINPDYICLAGWKQIVKDEVINAYPNRILNLHPGLVPDGYNAKGNTDVKNPDGTRALWNKGMLGDRAIENFLNTKATYAGSSIHFLTLNFDFGPVLGRAFEKIEPYDNVKSLYARLKKKENELYAEVLEKLCRKNQQN